MNCSLVRVRNHYRCLRCGGMYEDRAARECGTKVVTTEPIAAPGLGDHTERMLRGIGITPERYSAVKELFGLPPTCGCSKRKEWLNKVGEWFAAVSA